MSDAVDTLARANPVPESRRNQLDARASALTGSWRAVTSASAAPRRVSRRYVLVLAAGIALLLGAGTALALRAYWLDFSAAEPAPPKVVKSFAELDSYAPPGMATGVIAEEARRIPVPDNTGRIRTFWVAPTRHGGWCADVANVGGGCEKLGTIPLGTSWGAEGRAVPSATRDHPVITQVYGDANAKWVDSVAIRFDDGDVVHPPVVWVSAPIGAGFFFFEVPPEHRTAGHEVASVEAYDAAGNLVTRVDDRASANGAAPPPDAVLAQKREIARAATEDGDAVLWTAPTRYDATCSWVEIGGEVHAANCSPKGYVDELGGSRFQLVPTAHAVVVTGHFSDRYDRVALDFADHDSITMKLTGGFFLYAIPAQHLTPATQLVGMRALTRRGEPLINQQIPPGMPACSTALPTEEACP